MVILLFDNKGILKQIIKKDSECVSLKLMGGNNNAFSRVEKQMALDI